MDFGEILTKAWQMIWKHKILWLFGFLASCGTGGGGGGSSGTNANFNYQGGSGSGQGFFPPEWVQFAENFYKFMDQIPDYVFVIAAIVALILIIVIPLIILVIATFGRAGLVKGAWQADEGVERLSLGSLFRESLPYFWRIFLLYLVVTIAQIILLLIIIVPSVLIGVLTMGIGMICMGPLLCMCICLFIPLTWAIDVLLKLSTIAIVNENLGLIDGVSRAWQVAKAKTNIGNLILMAIILGIGGAIAGIVIALPILVIFIPIGIGIVAGGLTQSSYIMGTGVIIGIICFVIYLPVLIFLNSVLESYIWSAWTLTYRRISGAVLLSQ